MTASELTARVTATTVLAVLPLALGGWETIPVGIFAFYIAGSANEAAALGMILIAVAAITVAVINRVAGTRMGGMFG